MEYIRKKFVLGRNNKLDLRLDTPLELHGNQWFCALREFSLEQKWSLANESITIVFQNGLRTTIKPGFYHSVAQLDNVMAEMFPKIRSRRALPEDDKEDEQPYSVVDRITGTQRDSEDEDMEKEKQEKPQAKPTIQAISGSVVPKNTKPAATPPPATKPASQPAATKPDAQPTKEQAAAKPAPKPAVATPTAAKPAAQPAGTKPDAQPTKEQAAAKPAAKPAVATPTAAKPAAQLTATKPAAQPTKEQAAVKPAAKPASEQAAATPTTTKPAAAATKHVATPGETDPIPSKKSKLESFESVHKNLDPDRVKQTWVPQSGYFPEKNISYPKPKTVETMSGELPLPEKGDAQKLVYTPAVHKKKQSIKKMKDGSSAYPPGYDITTNTTDEEESEDETEDTQDIDDKDLTIPPPPPPPGKKGLPAIPKLATLESVKSEAEDVEMDQIAVPPPPPGRKPLLQVPKLATFELESEQETSEPSEDIKTDQILSLPPPPGRKSLPQVPKLFTPPSVLPTRETVSPFFNNYTKSGYESIRFDKNLESHYFVNFDHNIVKEIELSDGFVKALGYKNSVVHDGDIAHDFPSTGTNISHICMSINDVLRPLTDEDTAEIGIIPIIEHEKSVYSYSFTPVWFKLETTRLDLLSVEFKDFFGNPIACDNAHGHFALVFATHKR